jgi:ABC-type nitrate/sulfonate/bicarbonate transport system substrate-binding protein
MLAFFKKCIFITAILAIFSGSINLGAAWGADSDLFPIRVEIQTDFTEFQVGDALGIWEEEGIKIEYVGAPSPLSSYQMLEQGYIDVTTGHPDGVAKARLAGIKAKVIAPGMVDHPDFPHVRYFARTNGPIKSLEDIVGKKVAIDSFYSCNEGYLIYYLNQKGIKGEAEWVVLPDVGQMEQALTQELIDLTTSHAPHGSLAAQAGGNTQIASTWDIFHSTASGLSIRSVHEDLIAAHPDKVRAFAKGLYRIRTWINANMAEGIKISRTALGLDPNTGSVEWDGRWFAETPGIAKEDIELWFGISEAIGYWKHGDIKPEDIYTNEFAPTED